MKYSKYANEWLVDFHKNYERREQDGELFGFFDSYVAEKLVDSYNDAYMKPVWKAINKRIDDQIFTGKWFFSECIRAYDWRRGERRTRLEKKRELLTISKKAIELAEMIGGFEANYWANRSAQSAVNSIVNEHNNPPERRCKEDYISEKEYAPFGLPNLDLMLTRLSDNLISEAENPPLIAKPNVINALHIVFVRRLTISMREKFGQPLRTVVANTACVLYSNENIDEKFVRDNTRD